jgi:transcriptional regulator with XRE-family HTH domain
MMIFNKNKIVLKLDLLGAELKEARLAKNIKIKDAAKELKISGRYLEALESGRPDKLPPGIYVKNFLREYALYLDLDAEKLIAIYNIEAAPKINREKEDPFSKKVPGAHFFLAIPKIIKSSLIIIAVLVCAAYLTTCVKKIITAPALSLISPEDNLITNEHSVDIKGSTEPEAEIIINGELVLKDITGFFEKKINLKSGLNIISVTAQKKYSQKSSITKKILVKS